MTTIQKKSLKVGRYVDTNHVDAVIRNYKKERWVRNSEHIGKEDSLSVWYSVEELEGFIEKIKQHGGDGIKMYFAAYPEHFDKKPEYSGRQTIVMVATRSREIEGGKMANKDLYTNPGQILAYNMGSLCPPNCPTGTPTKPPTSPGEETGADDWGGIGVTIVDRGEKGLTIV